MSVTTKVSKKYQIVIPKSIRDLIDITEGDELVIDVDADRIIMRVRPKSYTKKLRGLYKELWKGVDPKKYVKDEREAWD